MTSASAEERDWRAGCECGRVGLCFRCQAASRIEWLERYNASTENELGRANTKRLQAEHERDCAVETLAAARIFLLDNGPMKLIAPMVDRLDKALGFAPIGADDVPADDTPPHLLAQGYRSGRTPSTEDKLGAAMKLIRKIAMNLEDQNGDECRDFLAREVFGSSAVPR